MTVSHAKVALDPWLGDRKRLPKDFGERYGGLKMAPQKGPGNTGQKPTGILYTVPREDLGLILGVTEKIE